MPNASSGLLLIAYDGSDPAGNAIDEAARLFPGAEAVVATVWETVGEAARAGRIALPDSVISEGVHNIDTATEAVAVETAAAGAERARAAGLDAAPVAFRGARSSWQGLIELCRQRGCSAIVIGSRGRSAAKSVLLGSVSSGVVHHGEVPVVVVPARAAG
jgi:nucleotide-binding universal stress UspA family protein